MNIKTWQERTRKEEYLCAQDMVPAMQAEIDELRAALQERDAEITMLRTVLAGVKQDEAAQRKVLEQAITRMDRARSILTDDNPRPECNWGMLDTSDLHKPSPQYKEF